MTQLNPAASALVYSTYLGGNGSEQGNGIAVDSSGFTYVAGETNSTNFPTTPGAFQPNPGGGTCGGSPCSDAFVAKLDPTQSGSASLICSTYLGGSSDDRGMGIAVDSNGDAYVTGSTSSANFPTANPIQAALGGGGADAFVATLRPRNCALADLLFSTYLGGSNFDEGRGIALDSTGDAYVTGSTSSTDFPTARPFQAASGGSGDAFVTKLLITAGPRASLSTTSLDFGNQLVGTTSAPQAVTLTNSGSTLLTITTIVASGDFAQTNNCPTGSSSLAAGASCAINITFTPTAAGDRTGAITITDNAPDSPQTVALAGTGTTDFSISASPTAATITAGQTATYTLTIGPLGTFNQTVSLSCGGAPAAATCSISPPSVTLNGSTPSTATVTVTSGARSMTAPVQGPEGLFPHIGARVGLPWLLWLLVLSMLASLAGRGHDRRPAWLSLAVAMLFVLLWTACGAGGGGRGAGGGGGGGNPGTPPGTYTLTLTGTSGSLEHSTTVHLTVN